MKKSQDNNANVVFLGYEQIHRSDAIAWIVVYVTGILIGILGVGRLTLIGQFLDDVVFTFIFGLFKYIVYLMLLTYCLFGLAKYRIKINFRIRMLIFGAIFLISAFISDVLLLYDYTHQTTRTIKIFSSDIFVVVMRHFINSWYQNSLFGARFASNLSFFNFNGEWFSIASSGGLFGELFVAITSYLTIFAPLIIAIACLIGLISWFFTGHIIGIFLTRNHWQHLQILKVDRNGNIKKPRNYVVKNKLNDIQDPDFLTKQVNFGYHKPDVMISRMSYKRATAEVEEHVPINLHDNMELDVPTYTRPPEVVKEQTIPQEQSEVSIASLHETFQKENTNSEPLEKVFVPTGKPKDIDNTANYIIPESYKNRQKQIDSNAITRARTKILNNSKITPFTANLKTVETKASVAPEPLETPAPPLSVAPKQSDLTHEPVGTKESFSAPIETKDLSDNTSNNISPEMDDYMNSQREKFAFLNALKHKNVADITSKDLPSNKPQTISKPSVNKELGVKPTTYLLPPMSLLKHYINKEMDTLKNEENAKKKADIISNNFFIFNIGAEVKGWMIGPAVTKFEIVINQGVKVDSVLRIDKELKLWLSTKLLRIEYPIPGKTSIGFEVPNVCRSIVGIADLLQNIPVAQRNTPLLVALGKDVNGGNIFLDLQKTPHLLIAGSTGSGKSVCVNSILISLIMLRTPKQVKLLLIDPKRVELSVYNDIPHLLAPVISKAKEANEALKRIIILMHERFNVFTNHQCRSLQEYNSQVPKKDRLPYIVVVIDELADLMNILGREVESSIQQITQMARAAGIHMVVATQRPSTDIITGVIKTNIPSRIAFSVANSIDSRTILDTKGAEQLLGKGDMLYQTIEDPSPSRAQGTFITFEEARDVIKYVKSEQKPEYSELFEDLNEGENAEGNGMDSATDVLYEEIKAYVVENSRASTSLLQRKFSIGYNRASRIMDALEDEGVIGPKNGAKPREVYG